MYLRHIETNHYKKESATKELMSKKTLAVELSKVKSFSTPKDEFEQHATDPDIAAQALWTAYMNGWIERKTIVDLGAGTGLLGIGCLLLGAKKVFFVEKDREAVTILEENLMKLREEYDTLGETEVIIGDVSFLKGVTADLVVQNPPFGTRNTHMDKMFLEKANVSKRQYLVAGISGDLVQGQHKDRALARNVDLIW